MKRWKRFEKEGKKKKLERETVNKFQQKTNIFNSNNEAGKKKK